MEYREALDRIQEGQKIVFGTRKEDFHIIGPEDRDYNTRRAFTKAEAEAAGQLAVAIA